MARGRRRGLWILGGLILLVLLTLSILSGFYVDVLWFREVGSSSVFWSILWAKVLLGAVFGLAFFALLYVNLLIVRRLTPRYRVFSPQQEVIERYRLAFEPYVGWLLPGLAVVIALFVAIGVAQQWDTFLLWRNSGGVEFGRTDPVFERDVSYYVFRLPFLKFLQGWLFSSLVGVTVIVGLAHYVWGGIRTQGVGERVAPQVKVHLSVLLGLVMLAKAWGYWLGRYDLLLSTRGVVTGASYTDINAQMPALTLLTIIAVVVAVVFFVNIRFRGWAFPVIGLGLLLFASVAAGAIWPAAVQRFQVAPQELQRERPYIEDNIRATRFAFGLDRITVQSVDTDLEVTEADIEANQGTIDNIRLWRREILGENLLQLQRSRQFYEFIDVDVDRYEIGGETRVVMIAAREVSQDGIPETAQTWQNLHLFYSHGYGVVANQVNTATGEGAPVFTVRDIPPVGEPDPEQDRIYFGELEEVPFVVVNTTRRELDYQGVAGDDQQQVLYDYEGDGGIEMGGFLQKLLFAWRYRDVNLLISDSITGDSRILINRDIHQRIPKVAPFLEYDADPYPAVVDDRLVWVQDAYTTTNTFPYAELLDAGDATGDALEGQINYIRNSVKVVVDAFDGSMTFYVVDEQDPIIRVWRNAFPDLFVSGQELPDEFRDHLRYPENLFQVQAATYTKYHVDDAEVFYSGTDRWAIPEDPTTFNPEEGEQPGVDTDLLAPYYVLMRLPGETEEEFVLFLPFTPAERETMVSWMAASSDPDSYGEIVAFELPAGRNVNGPTLAFSQINQDDAFSQQRTLLGQGGSQVLFGDLIVVPIEDSFLYVQPVFVKSSQQRAVPELKRVVVANGGRVGIGETLAEGLADSFGIDTDEPPDGGEPPEGTLEEQVAALIAEAVEHFEAAREALAAGDLGTYQTETEQAEELIRQAEELLRAAGGGEEPAESPSPTPSPTG